MMDLSKNETPVFYANFLRKVLWFLCFRGKKNLNTKTQTTLNPTKGNLYCRRIANPEIIRFGIGKSRTAP